MAPEASASRVVGPNPWTDHRTRPQLHRHHRRDPAV